MFIQYALVDPVFYFSWVVFVAFSICCHEYAHARVALQCGDTTAANHGHLSLNPLVQMGPQSLIMLALFGIAWGSVPVNGSAVRYARQRAQIALAGPFTNLLLCLIFSLLTVIAKQIGIQSAATFLFIGGAVNGTLFVFNILPIPILDGFAALSAFHTNLEEFARRYASIVFFVFILLLWSTPLGSFLFSTGYALEGSFIAFWQRLFAFIS
jgi:Zn-dependent protease